MSSGQYMYRTLRRDDMACKSPSDVVKHQKIVLVLLTCYLLLAVVKGSFPFAASPTSNWLQDAGPSKYSRHFRFAAEDREPKSQTICVRPASEDVGQHWWQLMRTGAWKVAKRDASSTAILFREDELTKTGRRLCLKQSQSQDSP